MVIKSLSDTLQHTIITYNTLEIGNRSEKDLTYATSEMLVDMDM